MDNFYTEEEKYWLTGGNTGTLPDRITPSKINVLKENEIFVFGSNIKGAHLGGAARAAYNKFGAEWGKGDCTFVQGCGATLECISSYQFLEKLDGIH